MNLWKLHGAGNDFLLIDDRTHQIKDRSSLANSLCHRQYGIGADGLIAVENSSIADVKMCYFNSDGSRAAMCGNGLRCFSKFVRDSGIIEQDRFTVETDDGIKDVAIIESSSAVSRITVEMGDVPTITSLLLSSPVRAIDETEVIFMHFGVPHAVVFVDEATSSTEEVLLLELMELASSLGPGMEKNPAFLEGSNINFVRLLSDDYLLLCTWERGAGRTLACGTGSCASAIAARARTAGVLGSVAASSAVLPEAVRVRMPGGEVTVRFAAAGAQRSGASDANAGSADVMVVLEGTAHLVCKAEVPDLL